MNRSDVGGTPFVKIALIGDSGVGKSTLTSVLATGCFELSPIYRPTIGCMIQVLQSVHDLQGKYFVELWDLGGNPRFADARPVCYEDCDGYIFLWDSSSEATYHSLQSWLAEVSQARRLYSLNSDKMGTIEKNLKSDLFDLEGGESRISIQSKSDEVEKKDYSIPLLIVANKIDKLSPSEKIALQSACSQQVFVSSRSLDEYDPAPFLKFFDEVYDKQRLSKDEDGYATVISSTSTSSSSFSSSSSSFAPKESNDGTGRIEHQKTCATPDDIVPEKIQNDDASKATSIFMNNNSGTERTWTSPLRGFTSSLFSLSSSASSLRFRTSKIPHTADHNHTLDCT